MQLEVITPEKVIFSDEIEELIAPTVDGEIAILPHHINLLTQLEPGELTIKTKGKLQHLAVTGGFLQMANGSISLLTDYAVRSEEINAKKALEAHTRAEKRMKEEKERMTEEEFAVVQADFRRAIAELKVAKRRHKGVLGPQIS
jgi:F-type H+-transporting ATPase subunit epsilon